MNHLLSPLDLSSLPSLEGTEASQTELGWSYTLDKETRLDQLLRDSSYDGKARKAIEMDIEDRQAMTAEKYGWILINLLNAQLNKVSDLGDMSSAKEVNRFLLRKVLNNI